MRMSDWSSDVCSSDLSCPLTETLTGFDDLRRDGKIRYWGVSNFDTDEMIALTALPGVQACATSQILSNLVRRGIEFDLLTWCAARSCSEERRVGKEGVSTGRSLWWSYP